MTRNTVKFTLKDGTEIGFRTGMLAISAACTKANCKTTEELFTKVGSIDMVATLALAYGAAFEYAEHNGKDTRFSMSDVSDWIEEIGNDNAEKLYKVILESYTPKNSSPSVEPGEMKEQPSTIGNTSPVLS